MKRLVVMGGLTVVVALLGTDVWAQTGMARGKVLDANGQPLVDVKIELTYQGGVNRKLETKTNKRGEFTQVGLPPGPYRITATKEGFQPVSVDSPISLGDATVIPDIKLAPKTASAGAASPVKGADDLQAAVDKAIELTNAGKFDDAAAVYKDLVAKNPSISELHYNLGYIYTQKKDWPNAEAEFQKVLELKPDNSDALVRLARCYQEEGQLDKAMEFLKKAAADHASDGKVMFTLGLYYQNAQKTAEAQEAFEKAEALDPANPEIQYQLGTIAVGNNKVPEAIARLEKYLSMSPKNPQNQATAQGLLQALKPKK
jgi:tetratricopeptide (TPR) repeat protein